MTRREQTYFTQQEAAEYLRLSYDAVKKAVQAGRIKAKKSGSGGGGRVLISKAALDEFFETLADA